MAQDELEGTGDVAHFLRHMAHAMHDMVDNVQPMHRKRTTRLLSTCIYMPFCFRKHGPGRRKRARRSSA